MDLSLKRNYSYDILRIIACFMVIVNHTNNVVFHNNFPSITGYLSLAYFFISKIAVPIFIMLTGALLLTKKETYKQIFTKRIFKILVALFVTSFLYYILPFLQKSNIKGINFFSFLNEFIQKPIIEPYWYLYMLIGLLICMPILRKMVVTLETKDYIYFFACWILFSSLIPTITTVLQLPIITSWFALPVFAAPFGYCLAGHFMGNVMDKEKANHKRILITAWIIFAVSILLSVLITRNEYITYGEILLKLDGYSALNTLLASISVFYLVNYYASKIKVSELVGKILMSISSATFGIFLLHVLLLNLIRFVFTWLSFRINDLIAIILYEVIIFILGYIITKILQRIPFIKKFL